MQMMNTDAAESIDCTYFTADVEGAISKKREEEEKSVEECSGEWGEEERERDVVVEVFICENAGLIVRHGSSSHPQLEMSAPVDEM